MLVQHFLPASPTTTTITNAASYSSSSPSPPVSLLTKNKKTSILLPFFNSESTGFQPTTDEHIRIGYSDKIKTHLFAWPTKLTSVMEIHRQRFSQLNPRFKQQEKTTTILYQPVQQPVILPNTSRPQPHPQARSKRTEQIHLPFRRPTTAHIKQQLPPVLEPQSQYITLANLTKLLHVLQTKDTISDNETSTDASISTTNSTKQRVHQHLQETATRWWKPIRSSDCRSSALTYNKSTVPTQILSSDVLQQRQESDNLPLLTVVPNSTRQLNMPSSSANGTARYDQSESSTEVQTTIISSVVPISKSVTTKHVPQEPLIMQARGMRLRSQDPHQYYNYQNNLNFLQQQRFIRQT